MRRRRFEGRVRGRLVAALLVAISMVLAGPVAAHKGHSNKAPWKACATAKIGAACSWNNAKHDRYVGSCRRIRQSLLCVRNQPIIKAARAMEPVGGVRAPLSPQAEHFLTWSNWMALFLK